MRWSILIPTLSRRGERFQRLLDVLLPQTLPYPDIEVVALWNHGERDLGVLRQLLLQDTQADYISYIDDDDMVPSYHCAEVMTALAATGFTVGSLGWIVQISADGVPDKPAYHSIAHRSWREDARGYYRNFSHVNVVRRDIAQIGDFRRRVQGCEEDQSWVRQVTRFLTNEVYINRVMYHYLWSVHDSVQTRTAVRPHLDNPVRPAIEHPRFRYHPASSPGDPR